jgi:hypothetical protein
MSTINKKALKKFVHELKTAVKEYNGSFEGLLHYVRTTPFMLDYLKQLEDEEQGLLHEKALKAARRAASKAPKPVQVDENGNPIVRKRGRPKGSKNKPKVVPEVAVLVSEVPAEF